MTQLNEGGIFVNIITIGRQFGSGGREIGKRLADLLGFDYYDREIITAVSEQENLSETYVQNLLENQAWGSIPLNFHHSFAAQSVMIQPQAKLLAAQREVIRRIGETGRDCVIVGRNADILLSDKKPFRIFVCATEAARIARCQERAEEGENLTVRAIRANIRRIDKNRAISREFLSDSRWGDPTAYDLVLNTTDCDIKNLVAAAAAFFRTRIGQ